MAHHKTKATPDPQVTAEHMMREALTAQDRWHKQRALTHPDYIAIERTMERFWMQGPIPHYRPLKAGSDESSKRSAPMTGFLDLTPEIRNMIYRLLLLDHDPIRIERITHAGDSPSGASRWTRQHLHGQAAGPIQTASSRHPNPRMIATLLISKLVAAEATPVLYSNTLEFRHLDDLNAFADHVGGLTKHFRHITLLDWTPFPLVRPALDFGKLIRASGLKTLEVCFAQLYGRERKEKGTGVKMFGYAIRPLLKPLHRGMRARGTPRGVLEIMQPVHWKSWSLGGQHWMMYDNRDGDDDGRGWEQRELDSITHRLQAMIAQMCGMRS